jgi:hypothetical protein
MAAFTFLVLLLVSAVSASPPASAAGIISVSFLYMPPSQIEPTYHTAIWLEDQNGRLVKTLFVSHDLSSTEYRMGDACPDWVNQAHWEKAEPSLVDAVTGPTPNVGSGALAFDVATLNLAAGAYQFKLQVHISDKYNVLYTGRLSIGAASNEATLDILYSPSKAPGGTEFVRDVRARYVPGPLK